MADGEPIAFTRAAAERIANAVRIVEIGERGPGGIEWETQQQDSPVSLSLRRCSWTANWAYDSTATIQFLSSTQSTATAVNVIFGVGPGNGWIARHGGIGVGSGPGVGAGWQLVSVNLTLQPGYAANKIQVFGHSSTSALMQWYSITTCSTATAS